MKYAKGFQRNSVSEPSGVLHIFDTDGPEQTFDTVQCAHCGKHWIWEPGSGRKRGYCTLCGGITCGDPRCDACVPVEQQVENAEKGREWDYRPIMVSVPSNIKAVK